MIPGATRPRRWIAALLAASAVACGDDGAGPDSRPAPPWSAVAAGEAHSCALADGAAYCWGDNGTGQVGLPLTQLSRSVPTRVSAEGEYLSIGVGVLHGCALRSDGGASCWGNNESSQLGNDSVRFFSTIPLSVTGAPAFEALAVGGYHACGLDGGGRARCWGWGSAGQLGSGSLDDLLDPAPVAGDPVFTELAAGDRHGCGLTAAGEAYCWGLGSSGQLGVGEAPEACGPREIPCATTPRLVAGEVRFRSITAGYGHSCALAGDGRAYCWGWGEFGQLGNGESGAGADRAVPVPVAGDHRFESLRAGGGFTCGLHADGSASCWGYGENGQLGRGSTASSSTPVPVAGEARFSLIAAGGWHACGLTPDREILCWGRNHRGQLGDGTTCDRSRPVRVRPPR